MEIPTILWCWSEVPAIRQYLPPDRVRLRILSKAGVPPSAEDLAVLARDADVIVVRRNFQITRKVIQEAKHLRLIQRMGRMTGNIDVTAAREAGVPVAALVMGLDMAVAEHAFMLMLALSRHLFESHHAVARGAYEEYALTPTVTTERAGHAECWIPLPMEALYHKTLGIIGMGEIGRAVAERARAFGMRILYCKRERLPEAEEREHGIEYASLERLLRAADFVSLHVPHTAETHRMLGAKEFAWMKPSAYLINVARGGVIDEEALTEALSKKVIAGAGLDVFEREPIPKGSPLLRLDNVICTPHSAAIYPQGSNIVHDVQRASENIFSILAGGTLVHGSLVTG